MYSIKVRFVGDTCLLRQNKDFRRIKASPLPRDDDQEEKKLANIKSAKKRILVTATRTERNKAIRSKVKTCIKKVETAVADGDKSAAESALLTATSEIDKATTKGVYHKNNASRKVSRLAKAVAAM